MEKIYQSMTEEGLQIPLALIREYGMGRGSKVVLMFEQDSIRILRAYPDRTTIENHALRYLLLHLGDSGTVEARSLPDEKDWQVDVYGAGLSEPIGKLVYDPFGVLLSEYSTSLDGFRHAATEASSR